MVYFENELQCSISSNTPFDQTEIKAKPRNTSDEYCITIIYTTQTHSTDKKTELDELYANVI